MQEFGSQHKSKAHQEQPESPHIKNELMQKVYKARTLEDLHAISRECASQSRAESLSYQDASDVDIEIAEKEKQLENELRESAIYTLSSPISRATIPQAVNEALFSITATQSQLLDREDVLELTTQAQLKLQRLRTPESSTHRSRLLSEILRATEPDFTLSGVDSLSPEDLETVFGAYAAKQKMLAEKSKKN